jgi:four helix bundle protein
MGVQISAYAHTLTRGSSCNRIRTRGVISSKFGGISRASSRGVSAGCQYEALVSWQLMHELNIEVCKATEGEDAVGDCDLRREIRDAADSAERNIVEGFERRNPLVFANFLDFSSTAARQARSLLRKGVASRCLSVEQFDRLDKLAVDALRAVVKFQRFLRSPGAKRITTGRYQRPYTTRISEPRNDAGSPTVQAASKAARSGT